MRLLIAFLIATAAHAYSVKGKTALVTGASGGIGAGIAKRLASEGAKVIVHYNERRDGALQTKQHIEDHGGCCLGVVQCDFRSNENIRRMVHDVLPQDGNIDILINNAGIITKMALEDDDDDVSLWHETLQVNVHAPLLLSKLIKQRMMPILDVHNDDDGDDSGDDARSCTDGIPQNGVIINVSSIHGERSVEYMGAYAASKAALDSLTRCLALEWAADGIRVNAIAPGVVPVERTQAAFADPAVTDMWKAKLPTDRLGSVADVANATMTMITNEWLTGTVWILDGGQLSRGNYPDRPRPAVPGKSKPVASSSSVSFES